MGRNEAPAQRYYSKIYWHFTGSPEGTNWHTVRRPSQIKNPPKDDRAATDRLKQILEDKTLKATATEKIAGYLESPPFCCVCDIPFKDLPFHATTYGRAAIGFHASAIHDRGFNPVLYISTDRLFELLPSDARIPDDHGVPEDLAFEDDEPASALFVQFLAPALPDVIGELGPYIKVSEFSADDEKTFYREREWRHIGHFHFRPEDVAALLVPDPFAAEVREHLTKHGYPAVLPVIPWSFIENA